MEDGEQTYLFVCYIPRWSSIIGKLYFIKLLGAVETKLIFFILVSLFKFFF